jgi:hypothetical protein
MWLVSRMSLSVMLVPPGWTRWMSLSKLPFQPPQTTICISAFAGEAASSASEAVSLLAQGVSSGSDDPAEFPGLGNRNL